MSQIVNLNQNLLAKYLVDSNFGLHTYDDIKQETSSELFKVTLKAADWNEETKEQIIESEVFLSEEYVYTISLLSSEDQIMWVGADISVASIDDGAATFAYTASKPTEDITIWIVREHLDGEVIISYATNEVVLNNSGEVVSCSMLYDEMVAVLEG